MTQKPVVFYRHEPRLVRPVFEQGAFGQMLVEPLRLTVANAAEQHEVRAACDHVNRVDLQLRHAANRAQHVRFRRFTARRRKQALGYQMQSAGGLQGDRLHAVGS